MTGQVSWHVLGDQIEQSTTLGAGGRGITDIYHVPYIIDTGPAAGHQGQVTIAASAFNPAAVKEAIEQQTGAVHSVAALAG